MDQVTKKGGSKTKVLFFVSLIVWLLALPFTIVMQFVARYFIATSLNFESNSLMAVINILSVLLGIYAFVGWIPALITGIAWQKSKKQASTL